MKAGKMIIETEIDDKQFQKDVDDMVEYVEDAGEDAGEGFSEGVEEKSSKINGILSRIMNKMTGIGQGMSSAIVSFISAIAGAGVGLTAIIGIIGIVIAGVLILAKAFEKVFNENEQLVLEIKYLVWVIGQALQPAINFVAGLIEGIIKMLIKAIRFVLSLLNYLTGGKLFANVEAEAFANSLQKSEDSARGLAGGLKEAKKQLAGFDEMNILNDTSSNGVGLGVGGVETPQFDFDTTIDDFEKFRDEWNIFGEEMRISIEEMPFEIWDKAFGNWGKALYGVTEFVYGLWELVTGFCKMFEGVWKMLTGLVTGDMDSFWRGIVEFFDGLWLWIDGTIRTIKGAIDTITGVIYGVINTIYGWLAWLINKAVEIWNGFKTKVEDVWYGIQYTIRSVINGITDWLGEKFGWIGTALGNIIGQGLKNVINGVLWWIEQKINGFIASINNGIYFFRKFGLDVQPLQFISIPRLARGGIVNNVGPGVMMGSYIAGEKGPEAVIPLTDATMDRLGEAFARHTTINANIINSMNGRVISRELQRIQNESDFAFNR